MDMGRWTGTLEKGETLLRATCDRRGWRGVGCSVHFWSCLFLFGLIFVEENALPMPSHVFLSYQLMMVEPTLNVVTFLTLFISLLYGPASLSDRG